MKKICIALLMVAINFVGIAQSKEDAAIKAVIEKETQSWFNHDAAGEISCLANTPYAHSLVYYGTTKTDAGVFYITNGKLDLLSSIKGSANMDGKPTGTTFVNKGYVIHVNGSSAFVYYDQADTAKDGKKTNFHEVRYLEKMGNDWKIVYVGAVKYLPSKK